MLTVREVRAMRASMTPETFSAQLGPFVLIQKPPDAVEAAKAMELAARGTVFIPRGRRGVDGMSLLFEFEELELAALPPLGSSEVLTVGRLPDNDVVVDHTSVSKRHAEVRWSNGRCTVADLGSTNGTLVNDALISAPVELKDGDIVTFGEVRFGFLLTPSLYRVMSRPPTQRSSSGSSNPAVPAPRTPTPPPTAAPVRPTASSPSSPAVPVTPAARAATPSAMKSNGPPQTPTRRPTPTLTPTPVVRRPVRDLDKTQPHIPASEVPTLPPYVGEPLPEINRARPERTQVVPVLGLAGTSGVGAEAASDAARRVDTGAAVPRTAAGPRGLGKDSTREPNAPVPSSNAAASSPPDAPREQTRVDRRRRRSARPPSGPQAAEPPELPEEPPTSPGEPFKRRKR